MSKTVFFIALISFLSAGLSASQYEDIRDFYAPPVVQQNSFASVNFTVYYDYTSYEDPRRSEFMQYIALYGKPIGSKSWKMICMWADVVTKGDSFSKFYSCNPMALVPAGDYVLRASVHTTDRLGCLSDVGHTPLPLDGCGDVEDKPVQVVK